MLLKKILPALTTTVMICSTAMASEYTAHPTITLGYQQGRLKDFGQLRGGNVKFQYETTSPWGVMGSLTAMKKDWENDITPTSSRRKRERKNGDPVKHDNKAIRNAEYFSAMVGPTYRLSKEVSLFALGGVSHTKVDKPLISGSQPNSLKKNGSESSNKFAYSAGVTVNPVEKVAVSVGYEGSRVMFNEKEHIMNSVFMNMGASF